MSTVSFAYDPMKFSLPLYQYPLRNLLFSGRESQSLALLENLRQHHVVQLIGDAKIGKSEIVTNFAAHHVHRTLQPLSEGQYGGYGQFDSASETSLKHDFIEIARETLEVTPYEVKFNDSALLEIAKQIVSTAKHCLFVFDNVSSPEVLRLFLPNLHESDVILTSQRKISETIPCIEVGLYTPKDAIAVIETALKENNPCKDDVVALAQAMNFVPEKIQQAIQYMRDCGITIKIYLNTRRQHPSKFP